MSAVRISAAISEYVSYTREFRSRCSRKEAPGKWWSTTPSLIASEILSPLCCFIVLHLLFPGRQQLCVTSEARNVPLQHSTEPRGHFWFPTSHHPTPHLHSIAHKTVLHDVQRLSIRQQAHDAVQIRAVRCVTRSRLILSDLNMLLTRRPHQLTPPSCHRRTVRSHLERPRRPSFLTIVFTRTHVWLRQESRVNQAQACSHLGVSSQLAVLSTLVSPHQVVLCATLSCPSAVEPHLLLPFLTTLPVSIDFSSRTLK